MPNPRRSTSNFGVSDIKQVSATRIDDQLHRHRAFVYESWRKLLVGKLTLRMFPSSCIFANYPKNNNELTIWDYRQLVISFYILTVDLWDEHAKVEHNLGIHPSSQMGNSSQAEPNHIQGVLTRNLIGNLATSASKLHDPEEELGIWFMLQDVRVRIGGSKC